MSPSLVFCESSISGLTRWMRMPERSFTSLDSIKGQIRWTCHDRHGPAFLATSVWDQDFFQLWLWWFGLGVVELSCDFAWSDDTPSRTSSLLSSNISAKKVSVFFVSCTCPDKRRFVGCLSIIFGRFCSAQPLAKGEDSPPKTVCMYIYIYIIYIYILYISKNWMVSLKKMGVFDGSRSCICEDSSQGT